MEFPERILEQIDISASGESLKEHYENPQIDSSRKIITYKPKRENLIPVENVKTINVNIPSDFYFLSDEDTKVPLETNFSNAFKINSTTLDKANIEIKFDSTCGELIEGSAGEKTYYLDQQLDLVFQQKEEYKIDGWKFEIKKGNEASEKDYRLFLDPVKISDDKTRLSVKISCGLEENEKIIITPECSLRNKLKVAFNSEIGTLTPATGTEKSYYLDDSFTASIKFPETHEFNGWKIYDAETKDPLEINEVFDIEENETAGNFVKSATFVVIDDTKNIIMEPDLQLRKILQVSFAAEHGSTTPSEPKRFYKNDTFNLSYSEDNGYAWTGWEIVDSNGNDASDCVQITGSGREVSVKAVKDDCSITIIAKYKRRPYVVSYSPTTATDDGTVMRDRTLVVIFDKRMDPSSIYFTKDELCAAGVYEKSGENYLLNNEYTLLLSGNEGDANRKPYGYFKTADTDGSSYVYKNIRITKLEDENVNLLKYYGEPVFDKNNPKTLRIYTKITNVDENGIPIPGQDMAPPQNIEILVNIGSGMVYDAGDGDFVATGTETPWAYVTNRKTDAEPPVIDNGSISIVPCDSDARAYRADEEHDFKNYYYTDSNDVSLAGAGKNKRITDDVSRIKTFNANTGYIWVQAAVTDRGSGPASMTGYFTKRYDHYYSKPGDEGKTPGEADGTPKSFKFDFIDNGTTRHIDQKINLADLDLEEGVYTLSFTSTDGNDHQTDSDCSYQFVYDVKKPEIKAFDHHRVSADKAKFLWENAFTSDFDRVEITTKNETKTAEDITNNFNKAHISSASGKPDGYQVEISSLTDETNYSHTLEFYDLAGNKTVIPVPKDISAPVAISDFSRTRNTSGNTEFSWTAPTEEDFSKIKIKYQIDEDGSEDAEQEELYAKDVNSKTLTGLTDYKHYRYTATVMDYAGNESAPVTIYDDTEAPAAIVKTTISNTRNSAANETIKWTNPTTSDFGKTIIEIYDGDTLKNSYDVAKGTASQLFDELEDRKGYKYKLRTVDYSGNKSAVTEWEDIVGPSTSSLVTKSTIKNVRTSADKETLSWTKPTALENSYYIVEQYSPSGALVSSKEVTRTESTKLFENMSRGKYKYRFYSVDYANNISNSYTEWQDDVLPTAKITDISNSRTSKDKETISWTNPTGAVFDDVDYMQIDQYDGTSLKDSFTWTPSSPATSKLFTSLTGGTKYTYKFSCVDYAGNKETAATDWQDNVRPTALVTKSTISGSRKAANNETVSWANPTGTGADEVSHIVIKQYYSITGTVLNDTFTQSDKEVLSNNFTGLTNQRRYEYRFYSVDYNGNISSNYTKYEDTTGPAAVTGLYSDAGQYRVSLHFTTPSTEDFDHIEVYRNSSTTKETLYADKARKTLASPTAKSTNYMVRPDSYAGSSDTWKVYAVDFAGNKSAVSQITEGYAKPGMIVYQTTEKGEPIVSSNWYGNFKCVGVLYTVDDYINVARTGSRKGNFVWDITEYLDIFIWGKNDWPQYKDTSQHDDGKRDYEMIVSNYRDQCVDYRDSRNPYNQTVWQYLEQTRNNNNKLTWWLPAIDDYKTIIKYMDDIDAGINFIRSNGGSVDFVKNQWYASSSVGNGHDSSRACYYQLRNNSFANKSHGYTDDTWKDLPGHSMWHFMTEVPLD